MIDKNPPTWLVFAFSALKETPQEVAPKAAAVGREGGFGFSRDTRYIELLKQTINV